MIVIMKELERKQHYREYSHKCRLFGSEKGSGPNRRPFRIRKIKLTYSSVILLYSCRTYHVNLRLTESKLTPRLNQLFF